MRMSMRKSVIESQRILLKINHGCWKREVCLGLSVCLGLDGFGFNFQQTNHFSSFKSDQPKNLGPSITTTYISN